MGGCLQFVAQRRLRAQCHRLLAAAQHEHTYTGATQAMLLAQRWLLAQRQRLLAAQTRVGSSELARLRGATIARANSPRLI